jgi:flavodoxin
MKAAVVYATRSGNTRQVAKAIAASLGEPGDVQLYPVESAPSTFEGIDLLVIGGPTEGHGRTPPIKDYMAGLDMAAIANHSVAAFDTRLAWPMILSGSAAAGIADRLRDLGGDLVVAPESFIVDRTPELKPGELERAEQWGRDLARLATGRPAVAAGV